jgi:hypothetical protein
MQLSNRVTSAKNTPHNSDYVDCSASPENGIAAKIDGCCPLSRGATPREKREGEGNPERKEDSNL